MKLPTVKQVTDILKEHRPKLCDWNGTGLQDYALEPIAKKIISYIKELQFDEQAEAPRIDPNLVRIAELEAKLKVYETIINAAGLNLTTSTLPPSEMGFVARNVKQK